MNVHANRPTRHKPKDMDKRGQPKHSRLRFRNRVLLRFPEILGQEVEKGVRSLYWKHLIPLAMKHNERCAAFGFPQIPITEKLKKAIAKKMSRQLKKGERIPLSLQMAPLI